MCIWQRLVNSWFKTVHSSPRVAQVEPSWAIHRSPRVAMRQQTCLMCDTADMSAVSHSRNVCCATQQTCLLCHTADMSAM